MLTRVVRVDPHEPDPAALAHAADLLAGGGLVAFPTETVYGLGAHALDPVAVRRLFEVKGRPADNPLIVHLADTAELGRIVAAVTPLAERLADRWWPGPLTLVLDAAPAVPTETTGGLATVAVRVPDHPVALALLRAAGVPVAAPSANRSGRPSPTTAAHVVADLDGLIDAVVDGGACPVGVESTVVDARGTSPVVLRDGAVTREDLGVALTAGAGDTAASPGTRHRHYAPNCAIEIVPAGAGGEVAARLATTGRTVGLIASRAAPPGVRALAIVDGAAALAHVLYEALRAAEQLGLDVVVVEAVGEDGIGRAVMDRLRRAAQR